MRRCMSPVERVASVFATSAVTLCVLMVSTISGRSASASRAPYRERRCRRNPDKL